MSNGDGTTKGKDERKEGESSGSVTAVIAEDDGVWSVFEPVDLFDDDISITDQSKTESISSWNYIQNNSSALSLEPDDNGDSMSDLQEVSDSDTKHDLDAKSESGDDKGSDWLSEVGDGESSGASTFRDELLNALFTELVDIFKDNISGDSATAVFTEEALLAGPCVELYDSGSTQHLSLYCSQFTSYYNIPVQPFTVANQQSFDATGTGDMVIKVLDGVNTPKLALTEVLYSPEIGYTLISVGCLDEAGYSTTFEQGRCKIHSSDGKHVGTIPKSSKGLYCVVHESVEPSSVGDITNSVITQITLLEVHYHFGHIAPAAIKCLLTHGFVTGLKLDLSGNDPMFCESCVYAQSCHQSIKFVRENAQSVLVRKFTLTCGDPHLSKLWVGAAILSHSQTIIPTTLTSISFGTSSILSVPTSHSKHGQSFISMP